MRRQIVSPLPKLEGDNFMHDDDFAMALLILLVEDGQQDRK